MLDTLVFSLAAAIVATLIILEFIRISQMKMEKTTHGFKGVGSFAIKEEDSKDCLHFLGYLATHPKNQPVPEECFGCEKAAECVNANPATVHKGKPTSLVGTELVHA